MDLHPLLVPCLSDLKAERWKKNIDEKDHQM